MRILTLIFLLSFSNIYAAKPAILITAATSGLGNAIAHDLASKNYDLYLAGRNMEKLKLLKKELSKYQINCDIYSFDYQDYASITALKEIINQPLTGIVLIPPRPMLPTNTLPQASEYEKTIKEHFIAPLEFIRLFKNNLQENSSIVIIGGITSVHYLPNYANANVLRLMWAGEVKNLAYLLGKNKIRANLISPDVILTDFQINKINAKAKENKITFAEQLKDQTKGIPLEKFGDPQDIADMTEFLLSNKSKHITGANLVIDGGLSKSY